LLNRRALFVEAQMLCGDEFVAVFFAIDIIQARQIAQRMQQAAAETNLEVTTRA